MASEPQRQSLLVSSLLHQRLPGERWRFGQKRPTAGFAGLIWLPLAFGLRLRQTVDQGVHGLAAAGPAHEVVLVREGYETQTFTFTVEPDRTTQVVRPLEAPKAAPAKTAPAKKTAAKKKAAS